MLGKSFMSLVSLVSLVSFPVLREPTSSIAPDPPTRYNLDSLARRWLMQGTWQIQEAKNKLSEVVEEAIEKGPQILTRRGVEVAVVLSFSEYLKLRKQQTPLSEFFRQSPLGELDLERDRSPVRPGPEL
ncbi:MAG TPA: type II toxin-antitoxin system Phd/YefM family antitoxin [Thermoanaerobaculia bacterium]